MSVTTAPKLQTRKGECEVCPNSSVITVILSGGGIWMCQQHWNEEQLTIAAQATIKEARKSDEATNVPYDVFVNVATPIVELVGAIQNDSTIPADQKNYAVVKEIESRIKSFTSAIFEDEKVIQAQIDAVKVKKSERMALIANAQNLVATLRADLRSQFGHLNVSMPAVTKTVKPAKSPVSNKPATGKPATKSFTRADLADLNEIADRYGVSSFTLKSMLLTSNTSMEDTAKELRRVMGLPPLV